MNLLTGVYWVFLTVYHEARGESALGQKNVVKVILNRAHKNNWPLKNVTLAKKQFSCFNSGLTAKRLWITDMAAAEQVMENIVTGMQEWSDGDTLRGATHYYATSIKEPSWAKHMEFISQEGNHKFYRES